MSDPGRFFSNAVQSLATQLAQEHTTVQEGPEQGQSLWEMLSPQQQDFFTSRSIPRARELLVAGATQQATTSPAPSHTTSAENAQGGSTLDLSDKARPMVTGPKS